MIDITKNFLGNLPVGFKLYEDDDLLYLYFYNKRVAIFYSIGTTIEAIEKEAQRYLEEMKKEIKNT